MHANIAAFPASKLLQKARALRCVHHTIAASCIGVQAQRVVRVMVSTSRRSLSKAPFCPSAQAAAEQVSHLSCCAADVLCYQGRACQPSSGADRTAAGCAVPAEPNHRHAAGETAQGGPEVSTFRQCWPAAACVCACTYTARVVLSRITDTAPELKVGLSMLAGVRGATRLLIGCC